MLMSKFQRGFALLFCLLPATGVMGQDWGLKEGYRGEVVVDGLCNPSSVTFNSDGQLTICDSGNGRVLLVRKGEATVFATGFPTEYWKVDAETGTKRFRLGPLSSVWVDSNTLAVTNAGEKDGEETVLFFDGRGPVTRGKATNSVGPTSDAEADKGEGNLCGLSISEDGKTLYLAGQGADAKTWVLSVDVAGRKLSPLLSADDAGIEINSPMDTLVWDESNLLVLYSGAGGKEDGLIVQWDLETKKPVRQWTLPGLNDPMGFARIPGSDELVVVDNNWSLTAVQPGKLARVSLTAKSGPANVDVIADELLGPVACRFAPDGDLYIAQLGKEFDKNYGQVLKVSGIAAK